MTKRRMRIWAAIMAVWMLVGAICLPLAFRNRAALAAEAASVQADAPAADAEAEATNPFINGDTVEIAAHRSGKNIAPENTLAAFKRAAQANRTGEFRVDIFEFDLRMTKDHQLILLHDKTLNRTTNIKKVYPGKLFYYPIDYTYEELSVLNAAVDYEDEEGNHPYAKLSGDEVPDDFRIPRFEDVAAFLKAERDATGYPYRFIIEIKDGDDLGREAVDMFYDILVKYDFLDSTVAGTFHNEISDYFTTKPGLMRSAGVKEVAQFLVSYLKGEDLSDKQLPYVALQIPKRVWWVQLPWLHSEEFIAYAHQYNIAVQYWTINWTSDMNTLAAYGADAIITDSPDKLSAVLAQDEWVIQSDYTLYLFLLLVVVLIVAIALAIAAIVRASKHASRRNHRKSVA